MSEGYVYILSNPSIPGQVKVGKTTNTPEIRARELSNTTGVPTPFIVEYAIKVKDCDFVEKEAHRVLTSRGIRTNSRREFFCVDVNEAKKVVDSVYYKKKYSNSRNKKILTANQIKNILIFFSIYQYYH